MPSSTTKTKSTKKTLIIDDEADMCLLLNIMLKQNDMELDHVNNIAAARDYLENEKPALVILDNRLPDGYGVDFVRFIKSKYPATKVIMISGSDVLTAEVAIEKGADVFLRKPFTKNQLFNLVA